MTLKSLLWYGNNFEIAKLLTQNKSFLLIYFSVRVSASNKLNTNIIINKTVNTKAKVGLEFTLVRQLYSLYKCH